MLQPWLALAACFVLAAESSPDMPENPLVQWFARSQAKFAQKWSSYLDVYHRYLQHLRNRSVHLLELGVQSGGSQLMWLEYFGPRARVYGVDVEPAVLQFQRGKRITNFVGDVGDAVFLQSVCQQIPALDVVVDDASHVNWHQRVAFQALYPCLNPDGGIYIVEDVDTSYKPALGGGFKSEGSFIEFAKERIDDLQAFWSCSKSAVSSAEGGCRRGALQVPITAFTRSTSAIHVHDGLIVFEKTRAREPAISVETGVSRIPKRFIGHSDFRPLFTQPAPARQSAASCSVPEVFSGALEIYSKSFRERFYAQLPKSYREQVGAHLREHIAAVSAKSDQSELADQCRSVMRVVREGLYWSALGMDFSAVQLGRAWSRAPVRWGNASRRLLKSLDEDILDVLHWYFAKRGTYYPLVALDLLYRSRARDIGALRFANARMAQAMQRDGYLRFKSLNLDMDLLAAEVSSALKGNTKAVATKAVHLHALEPLLRNHGILELASYYMGADVEVTGYKLLRIGSSVTRADYVSGLWHHDNCGSRLKLFVFLQDVGEDGMPLEIVRGSQSMAYYWYGSTHLSRFDDPVIDSYPVERLLSPRGGGFLFDTNAIHRGNVDGEHLARDAVVMEIANSQKLRAQVPVTGPCPEPGTYRVEDVRFPFPEKQQVSNWPFA